MDIYLLLYIIHLCININLHLASNASSGIYSRKAFMPCIKNFGRSLDKNTHKNVKKRVVLSCVERNMMFLHKKVSIERYKY